MSRWFRHYAGMMRDEKLVGAAIRCKQPVHLVVWVWGAILESASEINDDGIYRLDCAEVAYFLRADEADIRAVVDALAAAGRVDSDRVVKWGDRQFKSDQSAERQAKYRDRKRGAVRNGDDQPTASDGVVTAVSRNGDAPETDTELETDINTQPSAKSARRTRAELDRLEADLREAAGLTTDPAPGLLSLAPILGLLDGGHDRELDVLPTIRAVARRMKRPAGSWDYFVKPIQEASAKRRGLSASGLSPPVAGQGGNVFERLKRGLNDGPVRNSGGDGPVIDVVRSLPNGRGQGQRDDGEGLPDGDRRLQHPRVA